MAILPEILNLWERTAETAHGVSTTFTCDLSTPLLFIRPTYQLRYTTHTNPPFFFFHVPPCLTHLQLHHGLSFCLLLRHPPQASTARCPARRPLKVRRLLHHLLPWAVPTARRLRLSFAGECSPPFCDQEEPPHRWILDPDEESGAARRRRSRLRGLLGDAGGRRWGEGAGKLLSCIPSPVHR